MHKYTGHPKVISFEGPDRSGKSSVIAYVEKELRGLEIPVATVFSKDIDKLHVPDLIDKFPDEIVHMLFWQAIRLSEIYYMEPALKEGKHVLCYRGLLSNLAYSFGEMDHGFKRKICELYLDVCRLPDVVFLFYIDYDTFLKRDDGGTFMPEERFRAMVNLYYYWCQVLVQKGVEVKYIDGRLPLDDMCRSVLDDILVVSKGK